MGKNGLIKKLVKDVLENILEGEMEEHLGRSKYQRLDDEDFEKVNYRNGYSKKNLKSSFGDTDLNILRARNGNSNLKQLKSTKQYAMNQIKK